MFTAIRIINNSKTAIECSIQMCTHTFKCVYERIVRYQEAMACSSSDPWVVRLSVYKCWCWLVYVCCVNAAVRKTSSSLYAQQYHSFNTTSDPPIHTQCQCALKLCFKQLSRTHIYTHTNETSRWQTRLSVWHFSADEMLCSVFALTEITLNFSVAISSPTKTDGLRRFSFRTFQSQNIISFT